MKFVFCHQIPERSFKFKGRQFPVCARCTGILIGYCAFPLFYFGIIKLSILPIILLNLPIFIDGITQYMGWRESNNKLRLITGFLSSFALSGLVIIIGNALIPYVMSLKG